MQSYDVPALVVSDESENIPSLLRNRVEQTPNLPLFAIDNQDGTWSDLTAAEFEAKVIQVAKGLIGLGIAAGQAVAIMSRTRFEWTVLDFAIWYVGAVPVPIYETSAPSQMEWILSDSDCVALIAETSEHLERFEQIKSGAPLVRSVFSLEDSAIEKIIAKGTEISSETVLARSNSAKLSDLATIIYTSGTTGKPKGCELTHRGFVELSKNATLEMSEVVKIGHSTMLFIPLAHVFARFIEVLCVHGGVRVGHQPDSKNIAPAMVMASMPVRFSLRSPSSKMRRTISR